jgi:hypothetical protein
LRTAEGDVRVVVMAIRDKLAKSVQPHLEQGETLQSAFPVNTGPSPWLMAATGILPYRFFMAKYFVVAVTDRRIAVFKASAMAPTKPKELVASYPRETKLNRTGGTWGKIELGGTRYWTHRRFKKDVESADAGAAAAAAAAT